MIETRGLVALVEATDAMLKSANVEIIGPMIQVGNAMVTVCVSGDVAAVKANRTMEFGASDRLRVCIDRICTSATETRFQSNTFCPFRMKGRLISHS